MPALLFIEKPYYDNLLATGTSSPFRRKSASISLIYIVMLLKKCCVFYVNMVLILQDNCGDSKAESGSVCSAGNGSASDALPDAASDGHLSLTDADAGSWYNDPSFVPKLAVAGMCAHSLIFLYSMVWTHMGGTCSSGTGHDDDESDGDESGDDSDDDEPPP